METEGEKVLSFLSLLVQKVAELASKGRDNLYQAEFIMDKYTYLTSKTLRDHYFKKGEVEYILCGSNSELTNLLMVFQQVWFSRFAVNVLDNFLKCNLPHPLARLAYALATGFTGACSEVAQIYNGKAVPIFPDMPNLQLTYSDYLRLFLLIQENDTQLNRMRQLIQVNMRRMYTESDFNLANFQSAGRVQAGAEINLWFLPAEAFNKFGLDNFQRGKCRIVQDSVFAY